MLENSVTVLCTKFCNSGAGGRKRGKPTEVKRREGKEKVRGRKVKKMCAFCIVARTLFCDHVSTASVKGLIFV